MVKLCAERDAGGLGASRHLVSSFILVQNERLLGRCRWQVTGDRNKRDVGWNQLVV